MKIRDNQGKLFISFKTVEVNDHKGKSGEIFSCSCVYLRYHGESMYVCINLFKVGQIYTRVTKSM